MGLSLVSAARGHGAGAVPQASPDSAATEARRPSAGVPSLNTP